MTYYVGQSPEQFYNKKERYFYGLKRNDTTGMLAIDKVNLDNSAETVQLQNLSAVSGNLPSFDNLREGVDFLDGRNSAHDLVYDGLTYEQFKWDSDDLYYYIDEDGQLVVRINTPYNYPEGYTETVMIESIINTEYVDFGTITSSNPLENRIIADLGSIKDIETTVYAIDAGSII